MIKYGNMKEMLDQMSECLSEEDRRLFGLVPGHEPDRGLREGVERVMTEGHLSGSQELQPLTKMQHRKDLRPWQGKESDGEIMFNFESSLDAQDLYDFVLESGLCLPGEVRLHMSEHQFSVHFAPSVLVQKPDVIQMALIEFGPQAREESLEVWDALAEDVGTVLDVRKEISEASARGSAEPSSTGRGVDFNPFHNKEGKFASREDLRAGGSWSDGWTKGSKHLKATKKGKKLHFAATKLPCGRMARMKGKDIRCWDGNKGAGFELARAFSKKRRGGPRAMEAFSREDMRAVQECHRMYGTSSKISESVAKRLMR